MAKNEDTNISAKEFVKTVFWALRLNFRINKSYSSLLVMTSIITGIQGTVNAFVITRLIDVSINAVGKESPLTLIGPWILAVAGIQVFYNIVNSLQNYTFGSMYFVSEMKLRLLLNDKVRSLDIATLEDPEVNNRITRARESIMAVPRFMDNMLRIISALAALVAAFAIVFAFNPIVAVALIFISIPSIYISNHYLAIVWRLNLRLTEKRRSAYASIGYMLSSSYLHELKITNGVPYLTNHYQRLATYWTDRVLDIRKRWFTQSFLAELMPLGVRIFGYTLAFTEFIAGKISIGDASFYASSVDSFGRTLLGLGSEFSRLYERSQRVNESRLLFETESEYADGKVRMKSLSRGPRINIKNVSFKYPRSSKYVIKDLSLTIKSGEKIAIVGHNGAGKTTLVKLVSRFYPVTKGSININRKNLNSLAINSWYKNMGILFQDYNSYGNLNAEQNIFLGDLSKKSRKKRVRDAAKKADAHKFIEDFEEGYNQVLSEKYKGGIRPSTGQWQKIAIARFFYRNAPLVIFDEPTAAIDAVAEQKIFNKIYKFFKGKTVIIISHRFSTVRNADRIIVFEKGRIIEQGSHEELMKMGGSYKKAFDLQAKGYKSA